MLKPQRLAALQDWFQTAGGRADARIRQAILELGVFVHDRKYLGHLRIKEEWDVEKVIRGTCK